MGPGKRGLDYNSARRSLGTSALWSGDCAGRLHRGVQPFPAPPPPELFPRRASKAYNNTTPYSVLVCEKTRTLPFDSCYGYRPTQSLIETTLSGGNLQCGTWTAIVSSRPTTSNGHCLRQLTGSVISGARSSSQRKNSVAASLAVITVP